MAAGATGELLFWDRRTRRQAAKLDDTHMEEVTQVSARKGRQGLVARHALASPEAGRIKYCTRLCQECVPCHQLQLARVPLLGQAQVQPQLLQTETDSCSRQKPTVLPAVTTWQVRFHPSSRCVISGSIDGLVAVHDTCKPLSNDEAFVAAINVGTSVEELGSYGARGERLWVRAQGSFRQSA